VVMRLVSLKPPYSKDAVTLRSHEVTFTHTEM